MDKTTAGSRSRDGRQVIIRPVTATTSAGTVVARIESILEDILDCLAEGRELSIDFVVSRSGHSPQKVHFPGRNALEATKFARILLILQLAHDALVSGTVLTKRHIFYQHQGLFSKQRTVDELVDNLAFALNVQRDDLNIVASSKAVFSGPLCICLHDDTVVGPAIGDAVRIACLARCLSLASCLTARLGNAIAGNWIDKGDRLREYQMDSLPIKAKGYPDLLTCSFLQLVRFNCPQIPVFVLADYDPDGLNILRYYRLKSDIMSRERSPTAPDIRWLGIRSQDLLELETRLDQSATPLPIDLQPPNSQSSQQSASSRTSISSTECREPISPLSVRDRKLAVGMLDKLREARDDPDAIELQRELRVILMMSIKAEIQWLDEAGNLTEWLDVKLGQMLLES
ncbi:DNA topoisomerase IV, alpha subunit [Trichoderma reesei RUT C-30]|uniref:DNA topoisomerase (ATP-hydrolyzing) n=1 Tax=Hypocrea jecorina (strain ATCC 56765 / BCRC 32924 / NRRL 11460 / Rut C-30) TaxID=1344414 RepID=A0A024SCR6_HYPJR|nr:DNA topoisomerase IV, alpha subunit [Trichoderma reesei RUT C-30]